MSAEVSESRPHLRCDRPTEDLKNSDSARSKFVISFKENLIPSCFACTNRHEQLVATVIEPEQHSQCASRQICPIDRQRPTTYDVMASSLQKSMQENARKWCQRVVRDKGVEGLKAEFASIKFSVDPNMTTVFMRQLTGTRNRYQDVVCLDKTRVVLKNAENDYIHANFVSTPQHKKRFICTQGPIDSTCADFWRMVVQERSVVVLMLCNILEKQLKKCAKYFPARVGQTLTFENISVTCQMQKNLKLPNECTQNVTISSLVIVVDNNRNDPHYCDHYQWMDWPDKDVPPTNMTVITLLNAIRPCRYPIVVHCSAGIGRTGSIVMIEYVIELFLSGESFEKSDQILEKIRGQRSSSIQTSTQYLYVHRVLLEYFYRLNLLDHEQLPHIKKFIYDYSKITQI